MSKPVAWMNVVIGDLSGIDDEHLDAARRTAECHGNTLAWGTAAIGKLMAVAADSGEMTEDAARDAGWLLGCLGELSAVMADLQRSAAYEQEQRKVAAA